MSRNPVVVIPSKYKKYEEEELELVRTIYDRIEQVIYVRKPNPKYYITLPRLEEIKENKNIDTIIIMDKVKPSQIINLIREARREIVDRVSLILEIFALHAGSKEAKLQIELARVRHMLPIIKETIRYAKLGELHGFLGSGRYGYEKYYRMAKEKEARIRRELERLRKIRSLRRKHRKDLGYPLVSIIGYTCAGKTTLFNRLTGYTKPVGPEPFTTLSPKTASSYLNGYKVMFTDTVGFIRDLPPEIVEAFYATLEEIVESDIIINVVDANQKTHSVITEIHETRRTLEKIGVQGKPMIIALNKIDLLETSEVQKLISTISEVKGPHEIIVPISALKGINLEILCNIITNILNGEQHAKDLRVKIRT